MKLLLFNEMKCLAFDFMKKEKLDKAMSNSNNKEDVLKENEDGPRR